VVQDRADLNPFLERTRFVQQKLALLLSERQHFEHKQVQNAHFLYKASSAVAPDRFLCNVLAFQEKPVVSSIRRHTKISHEVEELSGLLDADLRAFQVEEKSK
jgi:hypothetical protein